MIRRVKKNNIIIEFKVKKSHFSKSIKVSMSGNNVLVTIPRFSSYKKADALVLDNIDKINKVLFSRKHRSLSLLEKNLDYYGNKEFAREFLTKLVQKYSKIYGFKYKKISIRNQSSRWGSCSSNKNLNFNYKLIFLPLVIAEYIVVHEVCHLKELNHSRKFWDLVSKTFPNYKEIDKELKKF